MVVTRPLLIFASIRPVVLLQHGRSPLHRTIADEHLFLHLPIATFVYSEAPRYSTGDSTKCHDFDLVKLH